MEPLKTSTQSTKLEREVVTSQYKLFSVTVTRERANGKPWKTVSQKIDCGDLGFFSKIRTYLRF